MRNLSLIHENYLSLSDIMVTEEKLLCTLTVGFYGLGTFQVFFSFFFFYAKFKIPKFEIQNSKCFCSFCFENWIFLKFCFGRLHSAKCTVKGRQPGGRHYCGSPAVDGDAAETEPLRGVPVTPGVSGGGSANIVRRSGHCRVSSGLEMLLLPKSLLARPVYHSLGRER